MLELDITFGPLRFRFAVSDAVSADEVVCVATETDTETAVDDDEEPRVGFHA